MEDNFNYNSFYNTINFSGEDLKKENAKAKNQEDLILCLFKANPDKLFSPSRIHTILGKKFQIYPPITSIRRAITNLTGRMELIKTDETVPGLYHLPEHTWKLRLSGTTVTKTGFTCTDSPNPQLDLFDLSPVTASWDDTIDRQ